MTAIPPTWGLLARPPSHSSGHLLVSLSLTYSLSQHAYGCPPCCPTSQQLPSDAEPVLLLGRSVFTPCSLHQQPSVIETPAERSPHLIQLHTLETQCCTHTASLPTPDTVPWLCRAPLLLHGPLSCLAASKPSAQAGPPRCPLTPALLQVVGRDRSQKESCFRQSTC